MEFDNSNIKIAGWTAFGINIVGFLFPVFPFINVLRCRLKYESLPITSISLTYVYYLCFFIYGDMIDSIHIKICFLIGAIINSVLIAIYLIFEVRNYIFDTIINVLLLILGTLAINRTCRYILDDDRYVGIVCNIAFSLAMINQSLLFYQVITTKDYEIIPIYNNYFSCGFSIVWLIYGFLINDFYWRFPYILNLIVNIGFITAYHLIKSKYPDFSQKKTENNRTEENSLKVMPINNEDALESKTISN